MQYLVFFFFAEYENLVGSIENNETLMFMTYNSLFFKFNSSQK